uniref:RNA-dependent RNA polymerase n=1 Tax=Psilocybe cubensis TaxID=181762 RepID=A0A8H7YB62_PSICU
MELYLNNVDWNLSRQQITEHLAVVLHGTSFADLSPRKPINFHVHLHPDKSGIRKHSGKGALTLPSPQIGERFLSLYGSQQPRFPLIIGRKTISVAISRKPNGRRDVVEKITLQRYMDPYADAEREREVTELNSRSIPVQIVQFGWECRDYVFSIECEHQCDMKTKLLFNAERREIRMNVCHIGREIYYIAMPFSNIDSIVIDHYLRREAAIVFVLNTAPTYECEEPLSKLRRRLSYLPIPGHERIAPYTSLAIRIVCPSSQDLTVFRRLCVAAHLHKQADYEYPIARRNIFSADALNSLQIHLRRFNWQVAFQIESLVRKMTVDVQEILYLIPSIGRMVEVEGKAFTSTMLRKFGINAKAMFVDEVDYEEVSIRECFDSTYKELKALKDTNTLKPTDDNIYDAFHVTITPTSMFLDGPFPERSNRVIRAYESKHHESFLRVSFVDEAKMKYRFDREIDGPQFIRERVGPILLEGLKIAGRKFDFLAYSQSALKEHAVWFVKPFRDHRRGYVNAEIIIAGLGNFHVGTDSKLLYCPARYAARLSQAFTATDAVKIEAEEILIVPDIKSPDGKYEFTDGVGTLSLDLAIEIWSRLKATKRRKRARPSVARAFQIRMGGSKGMLSVDHTLPGLTICLRDSMIKFDAPRTPFIEIAQSFDRPGNYYLNRPLIMLLEGLGVPYSVFRHYQDLAVESTKSAAQSLSEAAKLFESYGLGSSFRLTSVMMSLVKIGVHSLPGNPFYQKMMEYAINHILRDLKNKARIPIPNAWTLVGVADVHRFLQPNQIFACVQPINGKVKYLSGPVLISRSPTIHPGDVTIVHAIGHPPKGSCFAVEPLPNTVVFSVLGTRPVPSCLGGGDLDGDMYNLIPLDDLPEFYPTRLSEPASYAPAQRKLLDRPSTMADVAQFVMEYINSDVVGIIAINWLIIADQSKDGIFDADCLKLSQLHSDAVDYPKSGCPVELSQIPKLKIRIKPDWNAPETVNLDASDYYESTAAIGRLFRAIDLPVEQLQHGSTGGRRRHKENLTKDGVEEVQNLLRTLDLHTQNHVFRAVEGRVEEFIDTNSAWGEEDIEIVSSLFSRYTTELRGICALNTMSYSRGAQLTEEEAVVGTIVQKSSQPRKRADMMGKLRESTDILVRAIREELAGDDHTNDYEHLQRAWLAWELAVARKTTFGAHSFGWVALGAIFEAIRDIESLQEIGI